MGSQRLYKMGQKVWNGFGANHVNKESREPIPASADKTIQVLGLKDWCHGLRFATTVQDALRARVGSINTREKTRRGNLPEQTPGELDEIVSVAQTLVYKFRGQLLRFTAKDDVPIRLVVVRMSLFPLGTRRSAMTFWRS